MADPNRSKWNEQQKALQQALARPADHARAMELFLTQHAMLHASNMAKTGVHSFDDELWQDLSDAAARRIPPGEEHSIAWMIWHIARIEDITMNMLVAGTPQLFDQAGWFAKMRIPYRDTGNAMDAQTIADLSAAIDLAALRDYRTAAGLRTREIICHLTPADMKKQVDPARIQQVLAEGAVDPSSTWLTDYWGGKKIAGLLLMPPTRHLLVHLNEAMGIKKKRG